MLPAFTTAGLFVTGTDTGVGKTTISCAILRALRARGVCAVPLKPLVSGREADGTFEDIESLRRASGMNLSDDQLAPLRFDPPLSPAVAAEKTGQPIAWRKLAARIGELNTAGGPVLVEGVGGLLAPLEGARFTNREMIQNMRLPVVLVTRAGLGTLNHTAMTVELLRAGGAKIIGIVMNGAGDMDAAQSNREWIGKMTGVQVLAVVPKGTQGQVDEAVGAVKWEGWLGAHT